MQVTIYHLVVLPLALLSTLASLGFLRYTTELQSREMQYRLGVLSVRSETIDAADLLVRLKAEQAQNALKPARAQLPKEELATLAAFTEFHYSPASQNGMLFAEKLVSQMMKGLQRLAGIDPPEHVYAENGVDLLALAYNLERRRYFGEALVTFKKVYLAEHLPAVHDFAGLHSGYCLFFLGEYKLAREAWLAVAETGGLHNQHLARKLLLWLQKFEHSRARASRVADRRRRAESLYRILAYKESLEALLAMADRERDAAYYYLRGRVNEGPGNYGAAVEDFSQIVKMAPRGDLAVSANRRMLLMGTAYRPDEQLARQSAARARAAGDTAFLGVIAPLNAIAPAASITTGSEMQSEAAIKSLIGPAKPKPAAAAPLRYVRIRTHDGAIITGRLLELNRTHAVLLNENGRFRIPRADIASQENVSGK